MRLLSKSWFQFCAVFVVVLGLWLAGGLALHRNIVAQNNAVQLQDAAQQLMRRMETAVDYVVIAGTDLLTAGQISCSDEARDRLTRLVLRTGSVSDIYLVTETGVCSSLRGLSAELPALSEREAWQVARNPTYRLGSISGTDGDSLGVSWGLGSDLELVSAINADAALFDVLPRELRDTGQVHLHVGGEPLASFVGDLVRNADIGGWAGFTEEGSRYPLSVSIVIEPATLAAWHRQIPIGMAVAWTLLGLLVAGSGAFATIRGRNRDLEDVVRALTSKEIVPFFQPIVSIDTGEVVGCEALARWVKPQGDAISPARFIPLIEKYGLNDDLLSALMEYTARNLRKELTRRPDFYVSFNVTPDQLGDPGFADFLMGLARRVAMPPNQICIEVTERQAIAAPEIAARTTQRLAAAGFKLAIDDAGTGHNGLAAIQTLDVRMIKIDKFFVDHIDDDPRSRVMVDMFVSVAARYQIATIAEGVETPSQLAALRKAGVTFVQGYLFAPAVPADRMIEGLNGSWAQFSDTAQGANQNQAGPEPVAVSPMVPEPVDEDARLEALYRYNILDTEAEEVFDRIARIVQSALGVPMAAIALIDADRRWFKAVAGGKRGELPRHQSFCNTTIQHIGPTIVPDTLGDDGFRENPLVTGSPHIRAYLGVPLQTPDGHRIGSLCTIDTKPRSFSTSQIQLVKDMSKMVMDQLELRTLALSDALTSARSRRGFLSDASHALAESQAQAQPFAVLMLDIDHFKQINDNYGHRVGDEVLAGLCARITQCLGDTAVIGRMGGEEFAIALERTDLQSAYDHAERLRDDLANLPFDTHRGAIPITVSIGVAASVGAGDTLEDLIEQADWALYQAKGQGRNRVIQRNGSR